MLGEPLHAGTDGGDHPRCGAVQPELGVLREALHHHDSQVSETARAGTAAAPERPAPLVSTTSQDVAGARRTLDLISAPRSGTGTPRSIAHRVEEQRRADVAVDGHGEAPPSLVSSTASGRSAEGPVEQLAGLVVDAAAGHHTAREAAFLAPARRARSSAAAIPHEVMKRGGRRTAGPTDGAAGARARRRRRRGGGLACSPTRCASIRPVSAPGARSPGVEVRGRLPVGGGDRRGHAAALRAEEGGMGVPHSTQASRAIRPRGATTRPRRRSARGSRPNARGDARGRRAHPRPVAGPRDARAPRRPGGHDASREAGRRWRGPARRATAGRLAPPLVPRRAPGAYPPRREYASWAERGPRPPPRV